MEKFKREKIRVFVSAAAIILVSAAVFITSIQIVMGAEEQKVIEQAKSFEAASLSEPSQQVAEAVPVKAPLPEASETSDKASAEPSASQQPISEDDAIVACLWVANELFGLDVDRDSLTVNFNPREEYAYNNNGVTEKRISHETWSVFNSDISCSVDAASGAVIFAERQSYAYTGSSITLGEFETELNLSGLEDADNIYINAARDLVNAKLAQGRSIELIQIDGVQFVWDDDSEGFNTNAKGTVLVDCHVYMDTGLSYTLSFLGTDQILLHWFNSHPTHHACTWGYFYPENGADLPPESTTGEWYTAPGIVGGTYSDSGKRTPRLSNIPGN